MKPRLLDPRRMGYCLRVALACALLLWAAGWLGLRLLPMPEGVLTAGRGASVVLLDRHGRLLREAWTDERGAARWVSLDEVSPHLKEATLVAEDRRFFDHHGVDALATVRAAWQNLAAGEIRSGASTVTQQVVACTCGRVGGWKGKILEMARACRIEQELSKERILEIYLNVVPYGNNTRGAECAARYYFGRPASELSLAQATLLAAVPRGPSQYDPLRHLDRARERQRWILDEMLRTATITADAHRRALEEPLQVEAHAEAFRAPHFADVVQGRVRATGVTRVRTTLDLDVQSEVELIVRRDLQQVEDRGAGSGAVVVLDNATGEVLAMVGSPDFFDARNDGQVNGAVALRQPGSTLKPFTYGLALERGGTPADLVQDLPVRYPTPTGEYAPRNYEGIFHGPVRMRAALACSYNVPAVRTLHDLGAGGCELLLERLHRAGFASLERSAAHYGLGLTLGGGEVTLLELTGAYRALARGGTYSSERLWTAAWDAEGRAVDVVSTAAVLDRSPPVSPSSERLWENPAVSPSPGLPSEMHAARGAGSPSPSSRRVSTSERRVFSPQVAFLLADILSDPAARAPAFGLSSPLALPFACAVKTGTSQEFCDNWAVGFTTRYTVGVWVGNTRGRPMQGLPGVTGAAPIFRDVMLHLHRGAPPRPFSRPPGLSRMDVCPESGRPVGDACPHSVLEWFEAGREPVGTCREPLASHGRAHAPAMITGGSPGVDARSTLSATLAWRAGKTAAPETGLAVPGGARDGGVAIIRCPQDGDTYVIDPAIPLRYQALVLEAEVPQGTPIVTWEVNGHTLARVGSPYTAEWRLTRGQHVVRAVTASGLQATATFSVR